MKSLVRSLVRPRIALALGLALVRAGAAPAAQCPQPDALDGGACCTLAVEKVPHFPKVIQPSLDICWRECGIDNTGNCIAIWTPLNVQPSTGGNCGYRQARLDILDPTGVVKWTGTMRLLYARTWLEALPSGTPAQVWRFLVNGDLRSTSTVGVVPCPMPPCAPAFGNRVHYNGYIDYAQNCGAANPGTRIAWMLAHACDAIDHFAGFPRAGAFHPDRNYSFVGPAAGFVPAPVGPIEATALSLFESTRRLRHPATGTTGPILCEFEERASTTINPAGNLCLCTAVFPLNPQWAFSNVVVNGNCGTNLLAAGGPFLPGFFSMSIGRWTNGAVFPGVEDLRFNVADYSDTDPCTGAVTQKPFFGVTTFGGFPAAQLLSTGPGGALPPNFIDQASSVRLGGGPVLNVSSLSDQVINLNF